MKTNLILTIIGLSAVNIGLSIAIVAVVAQRSVRDEARPAEATDADMRYRGPEIQESTVVFREAAESVAESADLGMAAGTPSPVFRYVGARNLDRTAEPQAAPARIQEPTPDAPPAIERKQAEAASEPEAAEVTVEAAAGEPLGVSRIHIDNPSRPLTWQVDQPWHVHDRQTRSRHATPTSETGECPGSGGWGLNHHSSTFEEGVAHGYADVVRSTGECRHLNSLAMCNLQEAYGRALENRRKTVETYFELARINREERARQRGPRPTSEQVTRYARLRAPERLTSPGFDPASGTFAWPELLQDPQFAAERNAIDRLMRDRSLRNGGNTSESAANVKMLVECLRIKLKQQIQTLNPTEYVAAQKFLAGVEYEVYPRRPEIAASARLAQLAAK